MNTLGIKQFQQKASQVSRQVQAGETFIILSRSKPVMKLSPITDDDRWEPLIDFTELQAGGVSITDLLSRLQSSKDGQN